MRPSCPTAPEPSRFWKGFAASLAESKVDDGSIQSAKGAEKWATCLKHLFKAPWASYLVDKITHADLVDWRATLPKKKWERRNKKTGKVIKAGTLDDTSWVAPALHIWTESAMAFTVIPEGVQSYPRNIG